MIFVGQKNNKEQDQYLKMHGYVLWIKVINLNQKNILQQKQINIKYIMYKVNGLL